MLSMPNEDTAVRKIYFGERVEGRLLNTLALVLLSPDDSWCREIWRYMNAYDRLCELAPRCWRATDLDQADVIVYPHWLKPLPGEDAHRAFGGAYLGGCGPIRRARLGSVHLG